MRIVNRGFNFLERVIIKRRISVLKTLYVNFRMLPFKQAFKLPIFVYKKTRILSTSGHFIIQDPVKKGMITIGYHKCGAVKFPLAKTLLHCDGTVKISNHVIIANGASLIVYGGGYLCLNKSVFISENVRIICTNSIKIDEGTRIGHDTQIMDTNFHYIYDGVNKKISNNNGKIHIGDFNWIGNKCNLSKGCKTPPRTIVASFSLLSRDYSKIEKKGMVIAGIPGKVIKDQSYRIFDSELEIKLNNYFKLNKKDYSPSSEEIDFICNDK